MKGILAPHKEQDGWCYIRVAKDTERVNRQSEGFTFTWGNPAMWGQWHPHYPDSRPTERTISSRRVERAVETDDFLRLCESEGLWVEFGVGEWSVSEGRLGKDDFLSISGEGPTLREAYFRFRSLCPKEA